MEQEITQQDPFADDDVPTETAKDKMTKTMKRNEKPLEIVGEVVTAENPQVTINLPAAQSASPLQLGTYTRVGDLAPGPGFYKLEELEEIDIVILNATARESDFVDNSGKKTVYLSLEFAFADPSQNPDVDRGIEPYIVNVGGTVAVPKIATAMRKIHEGKATGPLVAQFLKKQTSTGVDFWDVF